MLIALAIIIFSLHRILSVMVANRPELFLVPCLFCIFKYFLLIMSVTLMFSLWFFKFFMDIHYTHTHMRAHTCVCVCVYSGCTGVQCVV